MRAQVTLLPTESKKLIAKALAEKFIRGYTNRNQGRSVC